MKQLRVLLLPPGRDASPSQGYPQWCLTTTHLSHLGGERQCGLKFPVQRNKMMAGTLASNHRPLDLKSNVLTTTPLGPQKTEMKLGDKLLDKSRETILLFSHLFTYFEEQANPFIQNTTCLSTLIWGNRKRKTCRKPHKIILIEEN